MKPASAQRVHARCARCSDLSERTPAPCLGMVTRLLTRRGGVAQPKAISSPHRSSVTPSQLSGRRGQPSYCEAPCPTSLLAPPGLTASDETTAPPHGGRRSTGWIFPMMLRCPRRIAAGTRTLIRWRRWPRSPPAAPSRRREVSAVAHQPPGGPRSRRGPRHGLVGGSGRVLKTWLLTLLVAFPFGLAALVTMYLVRRNS